MIYENDTSVENSTLSFTYKILPDLAGGEY